MRACWTTRLCVAATLLQVLLLTGCATPAYRPPPIINTTEAAMPEWRGRLNVTVQSNTPSSSSAGFLLRGDATHGELDLYSPLGTTLASLQWSPEHALLVNGSNIEYFSTLEALTEHATGAALPIAAIFDWLQNLDTLTLGWQTDLSKLAQGRLTAKRSSPMPEVTLRIQLD